MPDLPPSIAIIALDNPPVNSLGHALREQIVRLLAEAQNDPGVRGIVLTGNDKAFSAGADVSEFGTSRQLQAPILRDVLSAIESSRKPVVAALEGFALGGGLELAMACHGRVARENARVGLPEITLGLIPGSGGTQRLPRLIGPAAALALMTSGIVRTAGELANSGLFDAVVPGDPVEAATTLAARLANIGAPFPRARDIRLDPRSVDAAVAAQRDKLSARQKLQPAYGAVLEAAGALTLDFEEGVARERALFLQLVPTTAARALRYQFKAEREAARLPQALQAAPRRVASVAVIGAGTMGSGIAICALDASLDVVLLEQDQAALARGVDHIASQYHDRVAASKLDAEIAQSRLRRLRATTEWTQLAHADLVIEAVFEDLAVKQDVFRRIDTHAWPRAVLATNTSYLDVDAIAASTSRPQDVLGLHFFSPAQAMKLLEVVRGAATHPEVLATGMAFGAQLRKLPVLSGNAFGFIGNRIYNAYRCQCEFMLEDGAWPEEVDDALTGFGFAMGPFAVADLSGLDIAWRMRKAQADRRHPRERCVPVLDRLCEQGRLGRKTGAGYYTYAGGKQARTTDGVVRGLILAASAQRGIGRRQLAQDEIRRRALLAMVNEAALLVAEGVARQASDVDVVLVQGYGFPRWEGGPVFWARGQDRARLDDELRRMAAEAGHGFVRADLTPLLDA